MNITHSILTSALLAGLAVSASASIIGFENLAAPAVGESTTGSTWTINANDCCGGTSVEMTDTTLTMYGGYHNSSAFGNAVQNAGGNWTSSFSFSATSVAQFSTLSFVLQNDSREANALNNMNGGYIGVGAEITPAYSIVFGSNRLGFSEGGNATELSQAVGLGTGEETGLDYTSTIDVNVDYISGVLSVSLTDGTDTYNTSSTIDLASIVGGSTAYAGFSSTDQGNGNYTITNPSLVAVPEPSTIALFAGISALALGLIRRRR